MQLTSLQTMLPDMIKVRSIDVEITSLNGNRTHAIKILISDFCNMFWSLSGFTEQFALLINKACVPQHCLCESIQLVALIRRKQVFVIVTSPTAWHCSRWWWWWWWRRRRRRRRRWWQGWQWRQAKTSAIGRTSKTQYYRVIPSSTPIRWRVACKPQSQTRDPPKQTSLSTLEEFNRGGDVVVYDTIQMLIGALRFCRNCLVLHSLRYGLQLTVNQNCLNLCPSARQQHVNSDLLFVLRIIPTDTVDTKNPKLL